MRFVLREPVTKEELQNLQPLPDQKKDAAEQHSLPERKILDPRRINVFADEWKERSRA